LKDDFPFELVVIGDGTNRAELEQLSRHLGLEVRVRFAGRVPDAEMARQFQAADLFVLTPGETPLSFEGFGLVFLEANAAGTPVLAARTGGVGEAVADGESGFFVAAPTEDELCHSVTRFLRGEIRCDRATCRAHAAEFTWRKVVDRMEPVFDLVAHPGQARTVR
jgi:phosphatidylinositol alpha-1,6-mannosyltransferase